MMFLGSKKNILVLSIMIGLIVGTSCILGAQNQQSKPPQRQPAPAEDVTEEDLKKFSDTYGEIQDMQKALNTKIGKLIDESSFDQEKFNNLYQSQAKGNSTPVSQLNNSQKKEFNKIKNRIMELQNSQQEKMIEIIKDEGLTVERFNGILSAIQQDSTLYEKFQEVHQN